MNGTLETVDDRHTLRFERHLDHPVERVWRAITDPDELRHWFPPAGEPTSYDDSLEAWPEVHERYAEEFGVDPELGRKAIAEHRTQQE